LLFQELGIKGSVDQVVLHSIGQLDNTLDYMTDNFVIISKRDIAGISTHVCNNCLSFQFQFIKDIGFDLTAAERHRCLPAMVYEANKMENKATRYQQLCMMEAYDSLMKLTNSILTGNKQLIVDSTLTPAYLANFHAPLIKLDTITPDHWAWTPISSKIIGLTQIGLENFVARMGGTYAVILVRSGVHSGHHLMYIKVEPQIN